jgi:type II secretory ATPase GspE/PulE/Tfp pilus assembly ATPase PilB-like protein
VTNALLQLTQLGFSRNILDIYEKMILKPHGIILVTGPTGSGKTTALYASLDKINTIEKNIITIEDPIEYRLSGIRQIQVNPKVNMTFATGLRSILRQDPNVIMVGEIRDFETAEIAVESALTGHLVFSTLHTNDAAGAISRLVDMKIEPYLIASSLLCVLAQRLVRTICEDCKEKHVPAKEVLKEIGIDLQEGAKITFYRGKGCTKCMNTGYKGRIGIFELLVVDDEIRNLISIKAPLVDIRSKACAASMVVLRDAGIQKVKEGLTTIEEILRVTQEE